MEPCSAHVQFKKIKCCKTYILLLTSVSQDGDFVQFVEKLLAGRFVV